MNYETYFFWILCKRQFCFTATVDAIYIFKKIYIYSHSRFVCRQGSTVIFPTRITTNQNIKIGEILVCLHSMLFHDCTKSVWWNPLECTLNIKCIHDDVLSVGMILGVLGSAPHSSQLPSYIFVWEKFRPHSSSAKTT